MRNVIEADIEKPAIRFAKTRGWLVRKLRWIGINGAPDRVFMRNGRVMFIEFKKPGEPLKAHQEVEHGIMRDAGLEVHAVDSLERAYELLI